MKYLKLFESFDESEIREICYNYGIKNYTINTDGSIDINDNANIWKRNLTKIPLKFNKIKYDFDCHGNKLTSLEGSPVEVNGSFYCYGNNLKSFKGAPKIIRGDFTCNDNKINSFEYFPSHVGRYFWCAFNPIHEIWDLFLDITKIELLNDFDMFRDEDTDEPAIVMDRLNDFLLTIGTETVEKVYRYKNI